MLRCFPSIFLFKTNLSFFFRSGKSSSKAEKPSTSSSNVLNTNNNCNDNIPFLPIKFLDKKEVSEIDENDIPFLPIKFLDKKEVSEIDENDIPFLPIKFLDKKEVSEIDENDIPFLPNLLDNSSSTQICDSNKNIKNTPFFTNKKEDPCFDKVFNPIEELIEISASVVNLRTPLPSPEIKPKNPDTIIPPLMINENQNFFLKLNKVVESVKNESNLSDSLAGA